MTSTSRILRTCFLMLLMAAAPAAQGEARYRFSLEFGGRVLFNESGNQDLYRSQVNLGEGVKLFNLDLHLDSPHDVRFFDRFEFQMNSWGGEPYNTIRAKLSKTRAYELEFDYFNFQYFNAIPNFANPFFEQGVLQTQHRHDISHRIYSLRFAWKPGTRFSPFVAFGRNTRQGPVNTTLSLDGDEFTVNEDLETATQDFRGGFDLRFERFSLHLEQGVRAYDDDSSFQAIGFQEGNSARTLLGQDIFLEEYRAENDFSANIPFTNVVADWKPVEALHLRAKGAYSIGELDGRFFDRAEGNFLNFPGLAIFYQQGGRDAAAGAKNPSWYADFSADFEPAEWILLQQRFTTRRFHVSGSALNAFLFSEIDPLLGATDDPLLERSLLDTFLAMNLDTEELLANFLLTPRLSIRAGWRYQRKELEQFIDTETFQWDRNVAVVGLSYNFSAANRVGVDFELGRTETPPIFRSEPSDFERLRFNGQIQPLPELTVSGSIGLFLHNNNQFDIDLREDNKDYSLSATYTPNRRFSLTADYERSEIESDLFFVTPQNFRRARSIYLERGDFGNAYASFLFPYDVSLDLGYSFWDVVGTFPQSFHRPLARLEVPLHPRLTAFAEWNSYDYQERTRLFPQQYQAQLLNFGLRVLLEGGM